MANQMIALSGRPAQIRSPGSLAQQYGQVMNVMMQQRASERQAALAQQQIAQTRQQMDFARNAEGRAAAQAVPELSRAEALARTAETEFLTEFRAASIDAINRSRNPQEAIAEGQRLVQQFPGNDFVRQSVEQTLASIPQDPAQFEAWREDALYRTMNPEQQLGQNFTTQNLGTSTRIVATPEYRGGPGGNAATVVPGSEAEVTMRPTVVNVEGFGPVIVDPNTGMGYPAAAGGVGGYSPQGAGGAGGGTPAGTGSGRGNSPVAVALRTNPGALRDGPFTRSQPGYVGSSGGFAMFETEAQGIAAQEALLRGRTYVGGGVNTIDRIINRYAPQGPENSAASVANYKSYIADRLGVGINDTLTPTQVPALAQAMREFETGNRPGGRSGGGQAQTLPQAAEAATGEAYSAMEATVAKYDNTIAIAERLLNNPGLDTIVGNIQGNIPETALSLYSQDAANALADYNQLLAIAGFSELQNMREASPTGGALGPVSDAENRFLQNSAFTTARTQDEAVFRRALETYIARLRQSRGRVETAYERTFGRPFQPAPADTQSGRRSSTGQRAPAAGANRPRLSGDTANRFRRP